MAPVIRAILSHWHRKPGQLATLVIGLILATALWSAVQAINAEARASYQTAASVFGPTPLDRLDHPSGAIPLDHYAALRRAGWQVSPVLEGTLTFGDINVDVIGIDPLTAPNLPPAISANASATPVDILTGGTLFAAPETVERVLREADAPSELGPLEAIANIPPGQILTDISVAARLLDRPLGLSRLMIHPDQPADLPPLKELVPDLIRTSPAPEGDISRLTNSFHLNLTAFGLLSFAVGLFIVYGAIGLAFEQRRVMFRTLRALGVSATRLIALLMIEVLLVALVSGAIGVILGYLIAGALLPDVAATLRGLYGADVTNTLEFRPWWALGGLAVALGGTAIAATQSLWRVWHLPILAAARPRAWAMASDRSVQWQAVAGVGLIGIGLMAQLLTSGLVAGFALLAGVLLGAALILPAVLSVLLGLGQSRARSALSAWIWADTRQQVSGLSLALMALLLALATNIGVGTMVSSFRLTFTGWLDQRLASELYITAPTEEDAARLRPWLEARADAVLPIWSVPTRIGDRPADVFGFADHATYRENWPLLSATPRVWDEVATGQAALINEQLALRLHIGLGDALELSPGWTLPIAGIYSDYGNPAGQVMTSLAALESRFPKVSRLRHGVRIHPDKTEGLKRDLIQNFGLPADAIVDQAQIKGFSLGVFERTFTVTGALNVLTLGVAGFAMLTALLTLSTMRLPQLAPVWGIGVTRRRLAQLELLRSVGLAALTSALAVPLGLCLAWILLKVVNVAAFGWELPMYIFPWQWGLALLLALIASVLATLLPMRRLARTPPARFLQVFANER